MQNQSVEERLAVLETGDKYILDGIENIRKDIRALKYVSETECQSQQKLHRIELENFRKEFDCKISTTQSSVEMLRKDLNGAMQRVEASRKETSNKIWDVIKPILIFIAGALVTFVFGQNVFKGA